MTNKEPMCYWYVYPDINWYHALRYNHFCETAYVSIIQCIKPLVIISTSTYHSSSWYRWYTMGVTRCNSSFLEQLVQQIVHSRWSRLVTWSSDYYQHTLLFLSSAGTSDIVILWYFASSTEQLLTQNRNTPLTSQWPSQESSSPRSGGVRHLCA